MGIVVLGSCAVGANSLDEIVSLQTDANSVDELLVESAGRWHWDWRWCRWDIGQCAGAIDQDISRDAETGQSGKVVCRVGRANITGTSNEEESLRAGTAAILVDLVLAASGSGYSIGHAVTTLEVVPDDADALTEDVVVDLVEGAGDLDGRGTRGGRYVVGGLCSSMEGGVALSQ